jgi:transcriptional regulator GlxA family with amidase domain
MLARTMNAYKAIVDRVETVGRLHVDEALHIEFLCKHCRITERTLRAAFKTVYATTPYHHLHTLRLHEARLALLNPHPGATVTSVAMQFGFLELGRFSVEYREVFGERPSDTLRRSSESGVPLHAIQVASTPPTFRPPVGLEAVPSSARNANEAF